MATWCDFFELPIPLIQAPMAGVSTPALAAAVCNAGGIGSLGLGHLSIAQARQQIHALKALTPRPFNVNFFCHQPVAPFPAAEQKWLEILEPYFAEFGVAPPSSLSIPYVTAQHNPELIAMLCEERPAIVSFHFGIPEPHVIQQLQRAGIVVWGCATQLSEALVLAHSGVDGIIAQGFEAGGHRGVFDPNEDLQLGLLPLLGLLTRHIELPIIAAGGLMTGQQIAAVLKLGAHAVQLGTAFISCPESAADSHYRTQLLSARSLNTDVTSVISGRPARGLKNRMHTEIASFADFVPDYPIAYSAGKALHTAALQHNNTDFAAYWAGQGAPLSRAIAAADLVQLLCVEASQPQ